MSSGNRRTIINAQVPLAEMLRKTSGLHSITGGRGIFTVNRTTWRKASRST